MIYPLNSPNRSYEKEIPSKPSSTPLETTPEPSEESSISENEPIDEATVDESEEENEATKILEPLGEIENEDLEEERDDLIEPTDQELIGSRRRGRGRGNNEEENEALTKTKILKTPKVMRALI